MYCLLMAGGSGTRFWPRSREKTAKQFLNIYGKKSLIENTISRFEKIVSPENMYIVTKETQKKEIKNHIGNIPANNVIFEPVGKNTAPCIGLGALFIQHKDPEGILIVSPADHLIQKEKKFFQTLNTAVKVAEKNNCFVTIGITPDRPATGYGYIQSEKNIGPINNIDIYKVHTFAEKPDSETAEKFIESGDFYWNSGIFIFKVKTFFTAVKKFLPDLYKGLMEIKNSLGKKEFEKKLHIIYPRIKSISIDYGIMEKANNVYVVKGNFPWNDLGSWEQIYQISAKDKDGNVLNGNVITQEVQNSYISTDNMLAVVGLKNVVIVQNDGATIVCRKDKSEDIKNIVEQLKKKNLKKYL
ncbi:MAG: mannose-1-phosphate guanylyltransferase [bacterium]